MKKINNVADNKEVNDKKLIKLLQSLIRIPSWVPDDEDGKWTQNENKVVDFIETWLKENTNLVITRQALDYGRFNLIATKGRPDTIFLAHTDTVAPPINSKYSPLGGEVHDGKIWGRGSADMKSGIAALMQAAKISPDANNYAMFFYADEEYDFLGMKALVREYSNLRPKHLISADGADLKMGNGCRGLIEIRFRVVGKTAHAATGKGRNAVMGVYKIVNGLREYLETNAHPKMGVSSLNLAYVFGGNNVGEEGFVQDRLVRVGQEGNVVPNIAEAVIDIRPCSPDITAKTVLQEMYALAKKEKLVLELVHERHNLGAWFTDRSEIAGFEDMAAEVCKTPWIAFNDMSKSGYLDIQMLWEAVGKPSSLVFGAGSAQTEHTDNECVEIKNLVKTRDFFVKVLKNQG